MIRPARPDDMPAIAALWCEAFPGRRTVEDRVRMLESGGRYGGLETVIVAVDRDDRLVAACKLYRMEERILGTAVPMMGLAAVAVAPSHRRRGLGADLCTEAIRIGRERGDVVSALYPFRPDYYERLGWGLVGRLHEHRFRTEHLPRYPEAARVRPAAADDLDRIAACYRRATTGANGPIARDERVWWYRLAGEEIGVRPPDGPPAALELRQDPRRMVVVFDEGDVRGYALLRGVETRTRGDRSLHVRELLAEGEAGYRGLVGHIRSLCDDWPLGRHFARPEERFGDRLRDPRPPRHRRARSLYFPTHQVVRGPMLRVLDVPAALRARPWYAADDGRGPAGTLGITVVDREVPENEGPWAVRLDGGGGGGGSVVDLGRRASDATLAVEASTYARIHVGEVPPSEAARLGKAIIGGDAGLLDRAFAPGQGFWLPDEF